MYDDAREEPLDERTASHTISVECKPAKHNSQQEVVRHQTIPGVSSVLCSAMPPALIRACFVLREARGLRGRASVRPASTAPPGYAWPAPWERTARARATGTRCRALPGSSARWWGRRRAPLAQGGTSAPGSVGSTRRRARRGWCAAETRLRRPTNGVLQVSECIGTSTPPALDQRLF